MSTPARDSGAYVKWPYWLRHPIWYIGDRIWLDDLLRRRRLRKAARGMVLAWLRGEDLGLRMIELRVLAFDANEDLRDERYWDAYEQEQAES